MSVESPFGAIGGLPSCCCHVRRRHVRRRSCSIRLPKQANSIAGHVRVEHSQRQRHVERRRAEVAQSDRLLVLRLQTRHDQRGCQQPIDTHYPFRITYTHRLRCASDKRWLPNAGVQRHNLARRRPRGKVTDANIAASRRNIHLTCPPRRQQCFRKRSCRLCRLATKDRCQHIQILLFGSSNLNIS